MANTFFLDASALAKRYIPETGSAHVDAILAAIPRERLSVLSVGLGEVVSVLVRKRNAGLLSQEAFDAAMVAFDGEIVEAPEVVKVPTTRQLVTSSFDLISAHSVNATDALVLKSALALARRLRRAGDNLVRVAADQRLLRAAHAEGLATFDPETQDEAILVGLLSP